MSKRVNSMCTQNAQVGISLSVEDAARKVTVDEHENSDVNLMVVNEKYEGADDDHVYAKRRKKEESDSEVVRFLPKAVRIGNYMAPVYDEIVITSKHIIIPTSAVRKEVLKPPKDVRLKIETSEIHWVWVQNDGGVHLPHMIPHVKDEGVKKIRKALDMPLVEPKAGPFFSHDASDGSRRWMFITLDGLQSEQVLPKIRKIWQGLKYLSGPFCTTLYLSMVQDVVNRARINPEFTWTSGGETSLASWLQDARRKADNIKDIFDTTFFCIRCKSLPKKAVLCGHCSRMFCMNCYSRRLNCPYCFEEVMKAGLDKCGWVEDLVGYMKTAVTIDWRGVKETHLVAITKAAECFKCLVCYKMAKDVVLCPHCMKVFCRGCITVSVTSKEPSCSWCWADVTEKDLVTCRWGEELARRLQKHVEPATDDFSDSDVSDAGC